ncbi:MAG: DUF1707 domain-containing protein [Actinomycetia bacterium]|nr:DUF1707 domain-containing protein [Actinomycetes bacterium]
MSVDDPAGPIAAGDRAAAISELRRAAEDGRLSPSQLDQRLEQVQAAVLKGQLDAAMHGITREPGPLWPTADAGQTPAAVPLPQAPTPVGYRPDDRLIISSGASRETRSGRWTIPPYLRLQAGLSKVKLDCRQAVAAASVIDIEVGMGASDTVLVLPSGWAVDTDRLRKGIASVKVSVPRSPAPGYPLLVVHGQLALGSFVARGPNWVERTFEATT